MREVTRLGVKHASLLYRFLVENSKKDPSLLDPQLRQLTTNDIVIATCIDGYRIEQAFFIKIFDDSTLSLIVGHYSRDTVNILNMLCATGASHDPIILNHSFLVPEIDDYNFNECFKKSRLGGFEVKRKIRAQSDQRVIDVIIKYP